MRKRDILHSPRIAELKRKRRKVLWIKAGIVASVIIVVLIVLGFISRIEKLNISEIKIEGNKVVDTEAIQAIAQEHIAGKYIWLIPKSNFLFYPKDAIKASLADQFKRLKSIEIEFSGAKTLSIVVSEREPKFTWCGEELPQTEARAGEAHCYFVDESGYVFDEAPYFSGDVYFRFYGALTDSNFFPENFSKLVLFKDALVAFNMRPTSLYLKPDGDMEIYLSSSKLPPYAPKVIFKKDFDLEKTGENLKAAMDTEPLHSDFRLKYSSLEYIDLRFGNKVYFKFK